MPTKVKKPAKQQKLKRTGPVTDAEKDVVAMFVVDQPCEIKPEQITALARTLRRGKEVTKGIIDEARDRLVDNVGRYVDIHMAATSAALIGGTVAGLEVATKASQWAMANIGAEGSRVVEKSSAEPTGARIMIGIKVGGVDSPATSVAVGTLSNE